MSAALEHAVRSGRIRSNPARGLGLPRPKRRDYVYLTHAQVLGLAKLLSDDGSKLKAEVDKFLTAVRAA